MNQSCLSISLFTHTFPTLGALGPGIRGLSPPVPEALGFLAHWFTVYPEPCIKEEKQTEAESVLALWGMRSRGAEWASGEHPGGWRLCTKVRVDLATAKGS